MSCMCPGARDSLYGLSWGGTVLKCVSVMPTEGVDVSQWNTLVVLAVHSLEHTCSLSGQ